MSFFTGASLSKRDKNILGSWRRLDPKLLYHGDISTAEESVGLATGKKPVIREMISRKAGERPELPKAGDSLSPLSYDSLPSQKCKGSANANESPGTSTKLISEVFFLFSPPPPQTKKS